MRGASIVLVAFLLAGCGARPERGAIRVSLVGASPDAEPEALRGATDLGLLRLDEAGQLIEGMALRWAISDDGRDDIFRIDDGRGIDADRVARRLRATLRQLGSRRGTTADAVTDAVVALRSDQPRPELAQLLALPAQATIAPGRGPFRAIRRGGSAALMLAPQPRPGDDPYDPVTLRIERPGTAIARFLADRVDLVTGGTFVTLPIARVAAPRAELLRFDPASGMVGLARTAHADPALTPATIGALSLALDRDRIVELLGGIGTAKATAADGSTAEPPLSERQAAAHATLAALPRPLAPVRVLLPAGPGSHLLMRLIQADWGAVGVTALPAATLREADLALFDRVLPRTEQSRVACAASAGCDPADPAALAAPPFVPIMTPVRWSLVAPGLKRFATNPLAAHPLDRLR